MENTNKLQIGDKVSLKGYRNRLFGTVEEIIESPYADYALLVRTKPIKSIKTNIIFYRKVNYNLNLS